jgi:hypothetical protein
VELRLFCSRIVTLPFKTDFMRKGIILTGFLITLAVAAWAQPTITLMTFESYTFADKFDTEYGTGKIQDGFQWGAGLEFGLAETAAVELIYQRLDTDAYYDTYYSLGGTQRLEGQVGINYVMLGFTKYAPFSEKVAGFGTLDLGVGWMEISEDLDTSGTPTKFSWGGRLGVRFMASEKVSLRIHTQLFSPVQWSGGGFYFGTGGAGAGVTTGSTIYQFNLGGSLNFRLK